MKKEYYLLFSTLLYLPRDTVGENGETRVSLLGITGSGKSSTANSLLGRYPFKVSGESSLVTQNCQSATTPRNGRTLVVVDTPGFLDTGATYDFQSIREKILPCLYESSPGPHVILYVLQAGRFDPEQKEGMKIFLRLFGEEILDHTILVFTHITCSESEYMKDLHDDLQYIVDKCKSRYIYLPSPQEKQDHDLKINKLHDMIDDLLTTNKFGFYTEKMYQKAQQTYPQCEREKEYCETSEKDKTMEQAIKNEIETLRKENEIAKEEYKQKLLELQQKTKTARDHEREIDRLRQAIQYEQQERLRKYRRGRRPMMKIGPITFF